MTYELKAQPTGLAKADDETIAITFADGRTLKYPMEFLRAKCPCGMCIDEWTGEVLVRPEQIAGARVKKMEQVGGYAFSIHFVDGHATGIYTFKKLREWGESLV